MSSFYRTGVMDMSPTFGDFFDQSLFSFHHRIRQLDKRLVSVISQSFFRQNTVLDQLKTLEQTSVAVMGSSVRDDFDQLFFQAASSLQVSIRELSHRFNECKGNPPLFASVPSSIGAVLWARSLHHCLQVPIDKLQHIRQDISELPELHAMIRNFASFTLAVHDFEMEIFQAWCDRVTSSAKHELESSILCVEDVDEQEVFAGNCRVDCSNHRVEVKFSRGLSQLLVESRHFSYLEINDLPEEAETLKNRVQKIQQYYARLQVLVSEINGVKEDLLDVEKSLLYDVFESISSLVHDGITHFNWLSEYIPQFIEELSKTVRRLKHQASEISHCLTKIMESCSAIETPPEICPIQSSVCGFSEFARLQQSALDHYQDTMTSCSKLTKYVLQSTRNNLKVRSDSERWRAFVKFLSRMVYCSLLRGICSVLHDLLAILNCNYDSFPKTIFVEIAVDLRNNGNGYSMCFDLTSDTNERLENTLFQYIFDWIMDFINCGHFLSKLEDPTENYGKDVFLSAEISQLLHALGHTCEHIQNNCEEILDQFKCFEWIWTNDILSDATKRFEETLYCENGEFHLLSQEWQHLNGNELNAEAKDMSIFVELSSRDFGWHFDLGSVSSHLKRWVDTLQELDTLDDKVKIQCFYVSFTRIRKKLRGLILQRIDRVFQAIMETALNRITYVKMLISFSESFLTLDFWEKVLGDIDYFFPCTFAEVINSILNLDTRSKSLEIKTKVDRISRDMVCLYNGNPLFGHWMNEVALCSLNVDNPSALLFTAQLNSLMLLHSTILKDLHTLEKVLRYLMSTEGAEEGTTATTVGPSLVNQLDKESKKELHSLTVLQKLTIEGRSIDDAAKETCREWESLLSIVKMSRQSFSDTLQVSRYTVEKKFETHLSDVRNTHERLTTTFSQLSKGPGLDLRRLEENIIGWPSALQYVRDNADTIYNFLQRHLEDLNSVWNDHCRLCGCASIFSGGSFERLSLNTSFIQCYQKDSVRSLYIRPHSEWPVLATASETLRAQFEYLVSRKVLTDASYDIAVTVLGYWVIVWEKLCLDEFQHDMRRIALLADQFLDHHRSIPLFSVLIKTCKTMNNIVPLVTELFDHAVRRRHWTLVEFATGKRLPGIEGMTLGNVLSADLQKHRSSISYIVSLAKKEAKVEERLRKVKEYWKSASLTFTAYEDTATSAAESSTEIKTYIVTSADWVFEIIDEQQFEIQGALAYLSSMTNFELSSGLVQEWKSSHYNLCLELAELLATVRENVHMLLTAQNLWTTMEGVFTCSRDIAVSLPEETQRFQTIDAEFCSLLEEIYYSQCVADILGLKGQVDKLASIVGELEKCYKALHEYLDEKKKVFPRFFFVPDDAALKMLSYGNNPHKAIELVQSCFPNISNIALKTSLESCEEAKRMLIANGTISRGDDVAREYLIQFTKPNVACSLQSVHGERIEISPKPCLEGSTELWMSLLEHCVQTTMRGFAKDALEAEEAIRFSKNKMEWVNDYPMQTVLLTTRVVWTDVMEDALEKAESGDAEALVKMENDIQGIIDVCVGRLKSAKGSTLLEGKLAALIVFFLGSRDVLHQINELPRPTVESFEWKQQIRMYAGFADPDIIAKRLSSKLSGHDEPDLAEEKPNVDFQCRFHTPQELMREQVRVNIHGVVADVAHDYVGDYPHLVVTPLTSRCFLTIATAMRLVQGCQLSGPAGTGKSETAKELARLLEFPVYVFNCGPTLESTFMTNVLKGLCYLGAFGCFDEFNRLDISVLSVCSATIRSIFSSLESLHLSRSNDDEPNRKGDERFLSQGLETQCLLDGEYINVKSSCTILSTMNPNYSGRVEMPESMKAMFRPCAMVWPDSRRICEVLLFSHGFYHAQKLSDKLCSCLEIVKTMVSDCPQYDWGLRAVKGIVDLSFHHLQKLSHPSSTTYFHLELSLLYHAIHDFKKGSLLLHDEKPFDQVIASAFSEISDTDTAFVSDTEELDKAIKQVCSEHFLQPTTELVSAVHQLNNLLQVRHSVSVVGEPMKGKTTLWAILALALSNNASGGFIAQNNMLPTISIARSTSLGFQSRSSGDSSRVSCAYEQIPSKAYNHDELYGYNDISGTWQDGVLTHYFRALAKGEGAYSKSKGVIAKWLVLDGEVDAEWVEDMNSAMDDNKMLTLPSNERIMMPHDMRIVLETISMANATPATVSRTGVLYVAGSGTHRSMMDSFLSKCASQCQLLPREEIAVRTVVSEHFSTLIELVDSHFHDKSVSKESFVNSLCNYWHSLILETKLALGGDREKVRMNMIMIEALFFISAAWALLGVVCHKCTSISELYSIRRRISDVLRETFRNLSFSWPNLDETSTFFDVCMYPFVGNTQVGGSVTSGSTLSQYGARNVWINFEEVGVAPRWSLDTSAAPSRQDIASFGLQSIVLPSAIDNAVATMASVLLKRHHPVLVEAGRGGGLSLFLRWAGKKAAQVADSSVFEPPTARSNLQNDYDGSDEEEASVNSMSSRSENVATHACRYISVSPRWGLHEFQANLSNNLEQRGTRILSPKRTTSSDRDTKLLYIIDDCNLSYRDSRGSQPLAEFLRFLLDTGGWVDDRSNFSRKVITDVSLLMGQTIHYDKNSLISRRLSDRTNLLQTWPLSKESLSNIFTYIMNDTVPVRQEKFMETISDLCQTVDFAKRPNLMINYRSIFRALFAALQFLESGSGSDHHMDGLHDSIRSDLLECANAKTNLKDGDSTDEVITVIPLPTVSSSNFLYTAFEYTTLPSARIEDLFNAYCDDALSSKYIFFDEFSEVVRKVLKAIALPNDHFSITGPKGIGKRSAIEVSCSIAQAEIWELSCDHSASGAVEAGRSILRHLLSHMSSRVVAVLSEESLEDPHMVAVVNELTNPLVLPSFFEKEDRDYVYQSLRQQAKQLNLDVPKDKSEGLEGIAIRFIAQRLTIAVVLNCNDSPLGSRFPRFDTQFYHITLDHWSVDSYLTAAGNILLSDNIQSLRSRPSKIWCDLLNLPADIRIRSVSFQCIQSLAGTETGDNASEVCSQLAEMYMSTRNLFSSALSFSSFLNFVRQFKVVITWHLLHLKMQRSRLESGLQMIVDCNKDIVHTEQELNEAKENLDKKQEQINGILDQIESEKAVAMNQQGEVDRERQVASHLYDAEQAAEKEANEELQSAEPALIEARKAITSLDTSTLTELKSMKNPPSAIHTLGKVLHILLGNERVEFSWDVMKRMMSRIDLFKRRLEGIDARFDLKESQISKLQPLVFSDNFDFETMKSKNIAAAHLARWAQRMVEYHQVYKKIEPLIHRKEETEANRLEADKKLNKVEAKLRKVQQRLEGLEAKYSEANNQKLNLEKEAEELQQRLNRSHRIIDSLSSEKERWSNILEEKMEDFSYSCTVSILLAAFTQFSGTFVADERDKVHKEWERICDSTGFFDIENIKSWLVDQATNSVWRATGLSPDPVSIQNGAIAFSSPGWPLVYDPEGESFRWLSRLLQDNSDDESTVATYSSFHLLWPARESDEDRVFKPVREIVSLGGSILIEDLSSSQCPKGLKPLLHQDFEMFTESDIADTEWKVKIGGRVISMSSSFKIVVCSRSLNNIVEASKPFMTMINAEATQASMETVLLENAVTVCKPEVEQELVDVRNQLAEAEMNLRQYEDDMLNSLANSAGSILEDEKLVNTIERSRKASKEVQETIRHLTDTQRYLDQLREEFVEVAATVSTLVYSVQRMSAIQNSYACSFYQMVGVFTDVLQLANSKEKNSGKTISNNVTRQVMFEMFRYASLRFSSLDRLVLIVDFMHGLYHYVVRRIPKPACLNVSLLEEGTAFDFLREKQRSQGTEDSGLVSDTLSLEQRPTWLPAKRFSSLLELAHYVPDIDELLQEMLESSTRFNDWWRSSVPEANKMPLSWHIVDDRPVLKLAVIKALRPDRMLTAVKWCVRKTLANGEMYINPSARMSQLDTLREMFERTSPTTPLLLVCKRVEAEGLLNDFLEPQKESSGSIIRSLGEGREFSIDEDVDDAMRKGMKLAITNIHLSHRWMKKLNLLLKSAIKEKGGMSFSVHRNFRLILSCAEESVDWIPQSFLSDCVSVYLEPSENPQLMLRRSFTSIDRETYDDFDLKTRKLYVSLCLFHSLVTQRGSFGPVGFRLPYSFSSSEFNAAWTAISTEPEADTAEMWRTHRFMLSKLLYGGHVFNDSDQDLVDAYAQYYFREQLLSSMCMFPFHEEVIGRYFRNPRDREWAHKHLSVTFDETSTSYDRFFSFINACEALEDSHPFIFGLHVNATIDVNTELASQLVSKWKRMILSSSELQDNNSTDTNVSGFSQYCEELLGFVQDWMTLPDPRELTAQTEEEFTESYIYVVKSECEIFLRQAKVVFDDLIRLKHTDTSELVPEDNEIKQSLLLGEVPKKWKEMFWDTSYSLAPFVRLLHDAFKQIRSWTHDGAVVVPKAVWLPGVFNPAQLLCAVLQEHSMARSSSIETLRNRVKPTDKKDVSEVVGRPLLGVYLYGVSIEGARFSVRDRTLQLPEPLQPFSHLPVLVASCIESNKQKEGTGAVTIPVYRTKQRREKLFDIWCPSSISSTAWTLGGLAGTLEST